MTSLSDSLILDAARFARERHESQTRKVTAAPYITHPARVASRVALLPDASAEMVAAAWLHDVVEDTGTPLHEIEQRFGPVVARIVAGLTNHFTKEAYPDMNRRTRKVREIDRLMGQPLAIRRIKLLDRIDNLGEVDPFDDFTRVYILESQELLDAMRMATPGGTDRALEEELADSLRKLAAIRARDAM